MIRVGILRGAAGEHYESSLKKGGEIISSVFENLSDKYKPIDILVDKQGNWHLGGIPVSPADLAHKVDLVWNTAHPGIFNILRNFSIPHIGSGVFSSILKNSREMLQEHMRSIGVNMPRAIILPAYQEDFDAPRNKYAINKAKEILQKFPAPWVVKSLTPDHSMGPVRGREGSQRPSASNGMGVHIANTFPELVSAIEDGVAHGESTLIEELIAGRNFSMHSLSGFRGENIYVFPCLPDKQALSNLVADEKEKLIDLVRNIHTHLGAEHYLKSDFVLHPRKGFFLLGVDFSPDLGKGSHLEKMCESVGAKLHHVVEHILRRTTGGDGV